MKASSMESGSTSGVSSSIIARTWRPTAAYFFMSGLTTTASGADPEGLEHGHRRVHAVSAGDVAAGSHHAPVAAADDHGDVAKLRPVALLDRGIEGVAVEMGNREIVQLAVAEDARRSAGRAGSSIGGRPAAAVAAQRLHGKIIGSSARRAKTAILPGSRAGPCRQGTAIPPPPDGAEPCRRPFPPRSISSSP